ncbi:MAG: type II toxin-antitoxin system HicB family antitoxin [Coprothermobacterota bacterium]|nr:type II toxin-antitoxin system HicB family antitoxin [Coprothermobacterota bacterium]
MIREYIKKALQHARYELIDDPEPYYGEVPELPGVWATGATLEACRATLAEVLDGWLLIRISRGMLIPQLGQVGITIPKEVMVE